MDYEIIGFNANMHFSTIFVKRAAIDSQQIERFLGTFHLYAGAVFDYLCMCERRGSCKITVWDNRVCQIDDKSDKTWNNDKDKIFYESIPAWLRLLPEEFQNDKRCRRLYKKFFWLLTCSTWTCRNLKFHMMWDHPVCSIAGIMRRILLYVQAQVPVPRKFMRHGRKYKLYKIGPFRFSKESKRGRMHGSLDGAIQEKGQ